MLHLYVFDDNDDNETLGPPMLWLTSPSKYRWVRNAPMRPLYRTVISLKGSFHSTEYVVFGSSTVTTVRNQSRNWSAKFKHTLASYRGGLCETKYTILKTDPTTYPHVWFVSHSSWYLESL